MKLFKIIYQIIPVGPSGAITKNGPIGPDALASGGYGGDDGQYRGEGEFLKKKMFEKQYLMSLYIVNTIRCWKILIIKQKYTINAYK